MTAVSRERIRFPLLAIVAAAVGLIAARMIWPKLHFDTTSLILFGIATVAWSLAYVPVTKLKFGDFEAELEPLVAKLEQKVIASEAAATVRAVEHVEKRPGVVYREDGKGPDPAVVGALEEYRTVVGSGAPDTEKIVRVTALVERLAREGMVDPLARGALDTLQEVRDNIVQQRVELAPRRASEILDFAGRLVRTVAR